MFAGKKYLMLIKPPFKSRNRMLLAPEKVWSPILPHVTTSFTIFFLTSRSNSIMTFIIITSLFCIYIYIYIYVFLNVIVLPNFWTVRKPNHMMYAFLYIVFLHYYIFKTHRCYCSYPYFAHFRCYTKSHYVDILLCVLLLVDIGVVFSLELLWSELLWMFLCTGHDAHMWESHPVYT